MTPEETNRATKAADAVHEHRPVNPDYTRGGRPGGRILLILGGGLLLVIVAFALFWGIGGGFLAKTNANDGGQTVDTAAFQDDRAETPAADAPTTATGQAAPVATGDAPNVNAPTQPLN